MTTTRPDLYEFRAPTLRTREIYALGALIERLSNTPPLTILGLYGRIAPEWRPGLPLAPLAITIMEYAYAQAGGPEQAALPLGSETPEPLDDAVEDLIAEIEFNLSGVPNHIRSYQADPAPHRLATAQTAIERATAGWRDLMEILERELPRADQNQLSLPV